MEYILVGVGGTLGALARYSLGRSILGRSKSWFPVGTFIINITGAFLLGFLTVFQANRYLYLFCGEGFLGAYTTFSTFMYEGFNLYEGRKNLNAYIYIIGSLIIGIAGFFLGFWAGKLFE